MKTSNRKVVVTGGAGYVGSHVVLKLLKAGYVPVILDNFSNSSPSAVGRLKEISRREIEVVDMDIRDASALASVLPRIQPWAVIHCAGLKAVGESVISPLLYFDQNVGGTIALLKQMDEVGCRRIVFSSSATVYGEAEQVPSCEDSQARPCNPYGRTKFFIEEIIRDWCAVGEGRSAALLRYFNPIGADESGLIGENPKGIPNNLMPLILQVAAGKLGQLLIYGDDYDTPDGTGIRDYIHVDDLAWGHIAAMEFTERKQGPDVFNLGTGIGVSVLELISAFERVTGQTVPYRITARRPGDVPIYLADPSHARHVLNWRAVLDVDRMCADSWRFQKKFLANNDG